MTQPSSEKLAKALEEAGLPAMAAYARRDYYNDYFSELDLPSVQLETDLVNARTPAAEALRKRHHAGEFDATKAEGDAWAETPEGKAAFEALSPAMRTAVFGRK
jgi:hypothetical protein